jgi:hypothetical protein
MSRADAPPPEVRLSLSEYEALMTRARARSNATAAWTLGNATVELPADGGAMATWTMATSLTVQGEGALEVPLFATGVVIEDATFNGNALPIAERQGVLVAQFPGGSASGAVFVRYRVPVHGAGDGARAVVAPLLPVPGANLTLVGAVPGDIELWPGGETLTSNGAVRIAGGAAIVLRWGHSDDGVRRADWRVTIDPGSDGATVEARIEVFVEGARALVPLMPAQVALTDVREETRPLPTRIVGDMHRAVVTGAGRHVITATFRMGIDRSQGQPLLALPVPRTPMTRIEARVPGRRNVEVQPSAPVTHRFEGEGDATTTIALADLPPTQGATLTWTEPRSAPEQVTSANTETWQLVKIEEGVLRSRVEIRYEIIRGSLRELAVQLPDEAVLFRVAGDGVEDWRTFAATEESPRMARIFLGTEQEGSYRLELELEQIAPQTVGQKLAIPVVRPLGAAREMGVVALFDGARVGFAESTPEGYVRSGEDALPPEVRQKLAGDIVSQAFKHIGPPGTIASAVAAARTREIRFDAHVESLYTFQQNAMTVHGSVTIDVKSGRTDRVVLSLPRGVKVGSDVSAPSLKKADWVDGDDGTSPRRDFEIVLTRALEGTFRIELSLEQILGSELGALELPDIRVTAADVKKGDFGIAADPGMEVDQKSMNGLRKLDAAELPNSVRLRSRREVQLGYSYSWVDEPWSLVLNVRRHRTVETLTASIVRARVDTTLLPEGDVVHLATFTVDNKDRPWLKLTLPEGARLLGAMVAGERMEPIADESGALKIPLRKQSESLIALAWIGRVEGGGVLRTARIDAPKPDVFMTDFAWRVRVPAAMSLAGASTDLGSMKAVDWVEEEHPLARLVRLPDDGTFVARAWKADIVDVDDAERLHVELSLVGASRVLGWGLMALALGLMGFGLWRRVAAKSSPAVFYGFTGSGLLLLVAGVVIWGFGSGVLALAAIVLGLVVFLAWLRARQGVGA